MIDPNDYIIARKRKKYKFAKFANAENCFEFDEWKHYAVDTIEIGAGTGLFSVELASRSPEKVFVAIDVKADRLQKGAYDALSRGIKNVQFVRARADQLPEMFESQSVRTIWITFPDPFPKKRSAGRRLTHPTYLKKYAQLLQPEGSLLLKHDNPEFFQWSLEQLVDQHWQVCELSFDLHASNLTDEYKIMTTYEQKWLDEGRITQFVRSIPLL
jgi:tRNA (guanine-N7-)-methyltransferase